MRPIVTVFDMYWATTMPAEAQIPELKGSIGEGPNHSNHSIHSNHSNSFKIGIFPRKFQKFQTNWTFSKSSAKFRQNFIKIWAKIIENNSKLTNFCKMKILPKSAKKFDEQFLKYWGLGGAKACKSCRSRQELSNEYFLAKFGVNTEENEPSKVCSFGWKIRERFDIEPFN